MIYFAATWLLCFCGIALIPHDVLGFTTPVIPSSSSSSSRIGTSVSLAAKKINTNIRKQDSNNNNNDGEVGTGPNWIERSFPVETGVGDASPLSADDVKKAEDYDLGISGVSFQTGSLSKRTYYSDIYICKKHSMMYGR